MAARQRVFAARAQIIHQLLCVLGLQALVPAVVHHHERRPIAGAETFDLHQRKHTGRIGAVWFRSDGRHQLFGDPFRAAQRARQRAAHLHDERADRPRVKHRVERHDVFDVGWRTADDTRDVRDGAERHVAELPLHEIERRQNRRPAPYGIFRVPLCDRLEAFTVLRRIRKRLPIVDRHLPLRSMELAIIDFGVKCHLSTSPMTTSIEPITAMTSAMRPPRIIFGSAWHASSDGDRAFNRQGRLVPSETT